MSLQAGVSVLKTVGRMGARAERERGSAPPRGAGVVPLACLLVFMAQMATTLYLPSLPEVMRDLGLTQREVELSVSLFVLCAALPLLWWGRAAERWGRRVPLQLALLLFLLSCLALTHCTSLTQLLFWRALQGMAAGGATILGRILVRDVWQGDALARRLALLSMAFICALGGGQALGGLIARYGHWPLGFWLLAVLSVGALLVTRRIEMQCPQPAALAPWPAVRWLLRQPQYWLAVSVGGLGYALLVILQQTGPFVFRHDFALGATSYGALGLLFALCYLLGSVLVHQRALRDGAQRLLLRGAQLLAITGLAIGVWMTPGHVAGGAGLPVYVLLYGLAVFAQAVVFPNSMALAVSAGSAQGGMALALCGFLQQLLAGVAALMILLLPTQGGWALAVCLLGGLAWGAACRFLRPAAA